MLQSELKDMVTLLPIGEMIKYDDLPKQGQKMVIFDDFLTESKDIVKNITQYSIMARKKFCTCFYLVQSFFTSIDTKTIRKNLSYIILLKMTDKKNLNLIQQTLPHDIDPKITKSIIGNATKFKMNICIIDLMATDEEKIFRRNFNEYYDPNDLQLYNYDGLHN